MTEEKPHRYYGLQYTWSVGPMTLSNQALNILIARDLPAPGAATPTEFDPLTGRPLPGPAAQTVTQTIPARRYDPAVLDETETDRGAYFGINDSRYLVRQDAVNPWAVNDVFTDESGEPRRVVGLRNAQPQAHVAGGLLEIIGTTS